MSQGDSLNDSDALLADLDIDTLTSQALSQTQDNRILVESERELSCVSESQSQYFKSKFKNYKPTQVRDRKEVLLETASSLKPSSKQDMNETLFSFSFVGEDTICDESKLSGQNAPVSVHHSQVLDIAESFCKETKLKSQSVSSQFCSRSNSEGRQFHCTPYVRTDSVSTSVTETQPELTQTGATKTNSQAQFVSANTTLLKDHEGFKYRCTPFKKIAQSLCTQTQSQGELVSGTQFDSIFHQTCEGSQIQCLEGDSSQKGETPHHLSQGCTQSEIPSTGMCNMTGVFIESQDIHGNNVANISCDIFNESLCANRDVNTANTQCAADLEISSHTQSLVYSRKVDKKHSEQCKSGRSESTDGSFRKSHVEENNGGQKNDMRKEGGAHMKSEPVHDADALLSGDKQRREVLDGAVAVGNVGKSGTRTQELPGLAAGVPRTPGINGSSLQDKIKQRLLVSLMVYVYTVLSLVK